MSWADEASINELKTSGFYADEDDEPEPDWVTKDGQKLMFHEMETSHIHNCINMLRRNLATRPTSYGGPDPDDGDASYWTQIAEEAHNERLETELRKQIARFEKELERRA